MQLYCCCILYAMKPFSNDSSRKNVSESASAASEDAQQQPLKVAEQAGSVAGIRENEYTAVCQITPDGRILAANHAFCDRLGVNEIVKGKNILDYLSSSEKGLIARKFLLAHHHQRTFPVKFFPGTIASSSALEMEVKPQDNSLYLHEVKRVSVSKDKKKPAVTEADFIAEHIPLPVIIYNQVHEVQYVNSGFLDFSGYKSKEEVQALQEDVLFPAQSAVLQQLHLSVVRGNEVKASGQLQLRTNAGAERWVEVVISKLPDHELYMAVLQDIGQLKQQEWALNERQAEMEMFMDRAFHDLKGPINSLMALYALVEHEFKEDEQVMEYFRHYHQGITRLHRTLHDLLMLSRIQQAEPTFKPLSLQQMVEECLLSFKNLPSFYKIRFIKEINVQNPILTEENLLRTIVQNLLENAIKYSCEKDPEVRIAARQDGKGFWLEVSDNGIGIPEELQNKVFERFFRATTKASGSGLGLYLLRQAVAKLKGEASLQSVEGKGTTFSVFIPFL